MDFHLYLLSLHTPILEIAPIASKQKNISVTDYKFNAVFRRYSFRSITIVIIIRLICSTNVKTLKLKTVRTIQLHTLKLPTLIQLFLNYK